MLGIIIPLYDEAFLLIKKLTFQKIDGVYQYNGVIQNTKISLFLCKPQVKQKRQLQKWLKQHKWNLIIHLGLAGSLHPNVKHSTIFSISQVSFFDGHSFIKKNIQHQAFSYETSSVFTTDKIIYLSREKKQIYHQTKARLVDMEFVILNKIIPLFLKDIPFYTYKVVGDNFDDEKYLQHEQSLRSFFREKKGYKFLQLKNIKLCHVYFRKKRLQKKIWSIIKIFLE